MDYYKVEHEESLSNEPKINSEPTSETMTADFRH